MIYIGMDQTGAIDRKKNPKALPTCLLDGKLTQLFYLDTFNIESIKKLFPNLIEKNTVICIDCVMGLPLSLKVKWRSALKRTLKIDGYGRKAASEYFMELGCGLKPRREIEIKCQANSVFNEHPFQKNIQTGTFRFWKEMALNPDWFYAPAIESPIKNKMIPIYEGYPSLSWKILFGVKNREPQNLASLIRKHYPKIQWNQRLQKMIQQDPNLADAFVLALTAKFINDADTQPIHKEGWILGASHLK